jgi:hypothetical protein
MEKPFLKEFTVGWGDLDANNHMRNTAYLDMAATARFSFFTNAGFSASRFRELHFGPIVFKDEVEYSRELMLLEIFKVNFLQDGMNRDGSVFRIVNEFVNAGAGGPRWSKPTEPGSTLGNGRSSPLPPNFWPPCRAYRELLLTQRSCLAAPEVFRTDWT